MAANLNVLPIGGIANVYVQKLLQDLRNMQVGRQGFKLTVALIIEAVEGAGGGVADLATLFGVSEAQAQVLYNEAAAFHGKINNNGAITGLQDSWDKINRVCGISV